MDNKLLNSSLLILINMEEVPISDELKSKIKLGVKFWLEFDNKKLGGSGWTKLLENIDKNDGGSLTQALDIKPKAYSYKYAWNILKRIEERTGMSPVITGKGGRGGGGWIRLNDWGKYLLKRYKDYEKELNNLLNKIEKSS
ncbi:MAG: winged helix-turn-helix domain-containing protein [Promethearchaeota archaeon]